MQCHYCRVSRFLYISTETLRAKRAMFIWIHRIYLLQNKSFLGVLEHIPIYDCIRGSHVENSGHPTIMFRCILDDTSTLTYIFSTFILPQTACLTHRHDDIIWFIGSDIVYRDTFSWDNCIYSTEEKCIEVPFFNEKKIVTR